MTVILALVATLGLTAFGFLVAHRLLPLVLRVALRAFGWDLRLTPLMARRVKRFRSIRRGYWSFVLITSMFATSLFLELIVNNQALLIHYEGRYDSPALRQWANKWIPFVHIPEYLSADEWGFARPGRIDYRSYEPDALGRIIAEEEASLAQARTEFSTISPPEHGAPSRPIEPIEPVKPPEGASDEELKAYRKARSKWRKAHSEWETDLQMWELENAHFLKNPEKSRREFEAKQADYQAAERALLAREDSLASLRILRETMEGGRAWRLMPLYPYGPQEEILDIDGDPPYRPGEGGLILGASDNGSDVLVHLAYGFRISFLFAVLVGGIGYSIGTLVGGLMGYYGGTIDILMQRFVEIWESIPFLFTLMILASIVKPGLLVLALLLIILRSWIGITYTIRGEFYREKAKDYVQAAIAMGASDWKIITRHILPNSLVPIVSYAPFGIVAYISTLVSLDYLGYGLPPGTPSWGYLLKQGQDYIIPYPHLIIVPSIALAATLFCVVMIGESVREAFDPKVFSRLR